MAQTISEETKQQIIESAQARFSRYGYGKTTMAEIAGDCQMSAANLYRYFKSKEDIAVEIGNHCTQAKQAVLRAVVQRDDISAADRLESFIVELLRYTHNLVSTQPHISEIVESICGTHADIVKRCHEELGSLVTEILASGNQSGEFDIKNLPNAAEMIQIATVKFCYPPLLLQEGLSLEVLESQARALARLLSQGLAKR